MAPRLKRRLASLLKGFVRRRRRAASAAMSSVSTPAVDMGRDVFGCNRPPSPKSLNSTGKKQQKQKRLEEQSLSFLGLGLVFFDRSAAPIDVAATGASAEDLRLGVSLVAQTPGSQRQRLLLQEEIPLPLERCISDCRVCGGCGDGPMSEVTMRCAPTLQVDNSVKAIKKHSRPHLNYGFGH